MVSGSSGFIGTALVSALRQDGHDVVRLVRREPAAADERIWDPPAGGLDASALDGADAVVNLCGAGVGDKRWTGAYKQQIRDSRIEPTDVLARAVAERGISMMINGSAMGYYGDTAANAVDESAPVGDGFLAEMCRDWEAATRPAKDAGARVVLLRSGIVLAPSGGMLAQILPLFRRGLGGRLGNGRQYISWISMDDHLAATRFVIENGGVRGPVNLTSPEPVTNAAFTRELAAVLHRPAPWTVPAFLLRLGLGEFGESMLASQRVVPKVLREHGYQFVHPTLQACLQGEGVGVKSGR